jgi:hypothetical protein
MLPSSLREYVFGSRRLNRPAPASAGIFVLRGWLDDDFSCSGSPGAGPRRQRAHPGRSTCTHHRTLGRVTQGHRRGSSAGWLALDERRVRPLPADHGGVLELANAGGPQRPARPARHPGSRVSRDRSAHAHTRCPRGRYSPQRSRASPTPNCQAEWSSERGPTIDAMIRSCPRDIPYPGACWRPLA